MNAPIRAVDDAAVDAEQFVKVADACKELGVGKTKLYEMVKAGVLVARTLPGVRGERITRSSLRAYKARALKGET